MAKVRLTSHNRSKTSNCGGTVNKSSISDQVPADVSTSSLTNNNNNNDNINNNNNTSTSGQASRENSHRHTRSITRSPTPIKYDYDIYLKRSPTFGRRCPVLNRRLRRSSDRDSSANEDQPTSSLSEDHYSTANKSHDTPIVSSSISRVYRGHKGGNNFQSSSSSSFTTSYFQHDDRESHSRSRRLKTSHKRKQRKSPARWQHDLFDDDGPSSKKPVTSTSVKE